MGYLNSMAVPIIFFTLFLFLFGNFEWEDVISKSVDKSLRHTATATVSSLYNRTSYPGRFKRNSYPNMTITVQYHANAKASPVGRTDCAPGGGLTCKFSDKSWHEVTFDHNVITFPDSPKKPNKVYITVESPGRFTMNIPDNKNTKLHGGPFAGLALTDHRSDIPLTYLGNHNTGDIESIRQPVSDEITIWRVLHIASNCNYVYSGRNNWVQALIDRGLVDSFGNCQRNKEWKSVNHLTQNTTNKKEIKAALARKYAFVTAFENSYYSGYITEKLWEPLTEGTLPLYLGAPDAAHLLPQNSFINVNDFGPYDDLADYIEFLIKNKDEYYKYHAWRNEPISTDIEEIWKFAKEETNCRICRWGAENLFS